MASLEERLGDWAVSKEALSQDSEGRSELLRLAANRWNAVLAAIQDSPNGGGSEALQETTRRLNGLLDSMNQHSK